MTTASVKAEVDDESSKGYEVYCSGLPNEYSEDDFKAMFQKYCTRGKILKARYKKHVVGNQTAYGFLTFENEEDAKAAMNALHLTQMQGETLKVTDSTPPSYNSSNTNLYVEGLPLSWSESELKALFDQHGEIEHVKILINRRNNSRTGVGFVHYKTNADAKKAMDNLHDVIPSGENVPEGEAKPLQIRFAKEMGRPRGGRRRSRFRGGYGQGWGGYGMGRGGFRGGRGFGQWGGYGGQNWGGYSGWGGYGGYGGFAARGRGRGGYGSWGGNNYAPY